MSKDFIATIRETSARYQEWLSVMGTGEMPLKSPIPAWGRDPDDEVKLFFQMDLPLLTQEQRARLIQHIARKFGIDEQEVASTLDSEGCPILDEDVTVIIFNPQKWLGDIDYSYNDAFDEDEEYDEFDEEEYDV